MGSKAGGNASSLAYPGCAMIAKYVHQIANICSLKIIMRQYYWAVSLAWLCCAVHCHPSRGEERLCCLCTLSSQQWGCARPGGGQYLCSSSPRPPPNGLLPLFNEVLEQSRADTHVALVHISRALLNHEKGLPKDKPPNPCTEIRSKWGVRW